MEAAVGDERAAADAAVPAAAAASRLPLVSTATVFRGSAQMTRRAERTAADGDVGESLPPLWLEFSPSSLGVIDEPRARARSRDCW